MRPIFLAASIALLLSFSVVSAAPFPPTAATTTVENVYDPILKPYQARLTNTTCTTVCNLVFSKVTQDRVLIMHVSCTIALPSGASIANALLTTSDSADSNFLPMVSNAPVSGVSIAGTNSSTYLFVGKGDAAKVSFLVTGGNPGGLDCTISGYHA